MSVSDFFRKIFSRVLVGNCLGMIVAGCLLAAGSLYLIDWYTRHGVEVEVPDLTGLNEETAIKKLESIGLEAEVTDTGFVYRAAPFSILKQSILPGEKVKPGRVVCLTINADGPRKISLPDLADNCSLREAEDKLKVLGFKLGAKEYTIGQPDWVIDVKVNGRSVPAGTKVSVNTPITLVVGAGGIEDEYNGNDSLDYILNNPVPEDEPIEGETTDAPESTTP